MIELRNHKEEENRKQITKMFMILFAEALLVLADIMAFKMTGTTWLSLIAIIFGMVAVLFGGQRKSAGFVDFTHLSERAMLYVVFSFGEMIIGISDYFDGDFSLRSTYFALMAFLIVVGLFLSYGVFYDHIIDREMKTNGLKYMLGHIVLIFSMNNITNGLEFMQQEELALLPKIVFLVLSFILFFISLFTLGKGYVRTGCRKYDTLCTRAAVLCAVFASLMFLIRNDMFINIAATVLFIFVMFDMIYRYATMPEGRMSA